MALALESLVFNVETQKLKDAKDAIDNLAGAMQNLNKVQQDESKTAIQSAKVKEAEAKASEATSKAKIAETKAEELLNKGKKESTESTKQSVSVLERQQSILEFMTQGFSKGQSSVLAYAKSSGALSDELKQLEGVLQTQRKLIGGEPFDKSMSGLVALKNQYGEIREAIRQYNAENDLTRNQTRELARDKERIIEKMKLENASFSDIKQAIRNYNQAYTESASKVNSLIKVEKDRERTARDTANAVRNVQAAEERLFATVSHINGGMSQNVALNERAALALGSYERNLKLAGISGEQAAMKLQKFKAAQEQVSAAEAKNRSGYISRGIGVQMGDVAVSLASGMNPLTVAIQQGDQIRGLIQQSGLESAQMAGIMKQAFAGIITSFKDVGIAMGSFVLGGIQTMGKSLTNLAGNLTGFNVLMSDYEKKVLAAGPPTAAMQARLSALNLAVTGVGVAASASIALIGAMGIAMLQAAKANDALLISLTTSGASLGMSAGEVVKYSESMNKYSTSANELKAAIAALAAEGFKNKESLDVVTDAAQKYAQVTGKDLNDVMKEYAKVAKEPVESLTKLGEATGLVDIATLKSIQSMIEAGNTAGATKLAIEAYAAAQVQAAKDIESNLSPLGSLYITLKETAKGAWDEIAEFANSSLVVNSIKGISLAVVALIGVAREAGITFNHAAKGLYSFLNPFESFDPKKAFSDYQSELLAANKATTDLMNKIALGPQSSGSGTTSKDLGKSSAQISLEKDIQALRKEGMNDWEKHQQKMNAYAEKRKKVEDLYKDNESVRKENLGIIAKLEEEELSRYNEKINKSEKNSKALENEAKRLAELAKYYNLLAQAQSGRTEYNPDYNKKRADIEKLRGTGAISGEAYAFGLNELEQSQPWFKDYEKMSKSNEAIKLSTDNLNRSYQEQLDLQLLGIKSKNDSIGLTEREKQVNEQLIEVQKDHVKNMEKINDLVDKASKTMNPEELARYQASLLEQEKQANLARQVIVEQATKQSYDQAHSFEAGWDNAFASFTDSARNTAETGKMVFESMTNGMADAIVQFATTGKLSMKDFANTFIMEMLRMEARQASASLLGLGKGLLTGFLGASTGGIGGFAPAASSVSSALGSSPALGSGLTGFFADGGYTGSGSKYEPAGIVHKGEVVWSKQDVANAGGVGVVESMRKGIGGYADGGIVGNPNFMPQNKAVPTGDVQVNVTVASDGSSKVETNPQQNGKQFGDMIANAVRMEIIKEKRSGGLLTN